MSELALFSVAKEALAEARRVDEVKDIRDHAVRMRLYGEQARDRSIIADATEIISRAERRLGELIVSAKQTGQLGIGRPARSNLDGGDDGAPENGAPPEPFSRVTLQEAGISKKLSSRSQKLAELDETAFEAAMRKARDKIMEGGAVVVNPARDVSTAGKKAARAEREASLGRKQVALPEARFGVILADPEWRFGTWSEDGLDRAADNHYPTSDIETIKTRDVGSLAADDAVLFLWATAPMLPQALEVMAAWGFAYKSQAIWNKDRIGTGYWFRNKHELLLVGTRGKIPAPAMGDQFPSVIDAPVGEHSAKPEKFYEVIEAYYPTMPKIELNARQARAGWARWGLEAPEQNPTAKAADDQTAPGGIPGFQGEEHDDESDRGRARGLARAGDDQEGRAEGREDGGGRDGGAEYHQGLLHPLGHADHRDRGAAAAGVAPDDNAQAVVPESATAPLSTAEADAIIRAAYEGNTAGGPIVGLLAAQIGRPGKAGKAYVRNRARVMGLSSRDNQRSAASAFATSQHAARREPAP